MTTSASRTVTAGVAVPRSTRLRARRLKPVDLSLGPIQATASHPSLGNFEADVADISLHGLALVLRKTSGRAPLLLAGDRLEPLRVVHAGVSLFDGSGTVRRIDDSEGQTVIGVSLDSGATTLDDLHRQAVRSGFAKRWQVADRAALASGISAGMKGWTADLRGYLEAVAGFLEEEESRLASEDLYTRAETLQQHLEEAGPVFLERMEEARSDLGARVKDFSEEEHAAHRSYVRSQLGALIARSPLFRRATEKPLGYAGDFEMMNMIYRPHPEGEGLFDKLMNLYAKAEPASQAVINRVDYLGNLIRAAIREVPVGRIRIASIACGPARELSALLEASPELGQRLEVTLIDQEERSIAYGERCLAPVAARTGLRCHFVRESIRRLLGSNSLSETLGAQHLIYSAGLFDYLNDRSFTALLSALFDALHPGGLVAVGNVAEGNPSRWIMEYFCEWFLIHRTPEDLLRLAALLQPHAAQVTVDSEPLGINLFLRVRR